MSSRYFSPVEGHAVSRFGHPDLLVGAERDRGVDGGVRWDTGAIVEIPEPECRAFQREYDRAVRDGSLIEREAPAQGTDVPADGVERTHELQASKVVRRASKLGEPQPDPVPTKE